METLSEVNDQSVTIDVIRTCLQEVELFAGLSHDQLTAVGELCQVLSYKDGDVIFYESSVGTELFVTLKGQVRVEIRLLSEDTTTSIYQVGRHEVFGEFALLDGQRRSATVVANGPLVALSLTRDELFALMEAEPRMGYIIMRNLGNVLATKLRHVNLDLRGLLASQKRLFNIVV